MTENVAENVAENGTENAPVAANLEVGPCLEVYNTYLSKQGPTRVVGV